MPTLAADVAGAAALSFLLNGVVPAIELELSGDAEASDAFLVELLASIRSRAEAAAALSAHGILAATVNDAASASDALTFASLLLLSAQGEAGADVAATRRLYEVLEDALLATGMVESRLQAMIALAAAAEVEARLRAGVGLQIGDNAEAVAVIAARVLAQVDVIAAAEAEGELTNAVRVVLLVDDAASAADDLATVWRGSADLAAAAVAYITVRIGGTEYRGWALNTDLRAVTEHRNVPFDSFATYRGRHYAAGPMGIVEITGDTDDGQPIDAWFRPFLTNFGTDKLKRVPDVYLGITAEGEMFLKAITRDPRTGVQYEDWYLVENKQGAGPGNGRAEIGRGLKSVWWGLEVRNINGADFRTRTIQWRPLVLDRRV